MRLESIGVEGMSILKDGYGVHSVQSTCPACGEYVHLEIDDEFAKGSPKCYSCGVGFEMIIVQTSEFEKYFDEQRKNQEPILVSLH